MAAKQGRYTDFEILDRMLGEDLLELSYDNPLSDKVPAQAGFDHNVYMADFVTAENTGIVHIAPGHGMDDFMLGVEHELPIFCPVGPDGRYTSDAGEYEGKYVKEVDELIISDLEERGNLLKKGMVSSLVTWKKGETCSKKAWSATGMVTAGGARPRLFISPPSSGS